ncbi:MAG: TraB/GumN family protein [Bacteroidota bacterium]
MKKGLLWKISHPNLPYISYLFGTMHVRDAKAFQQLEKVYTAILNCEVFAAEYNLNESGSSLDIGVLYLPDQQRLADFMRPKQYEKAQRMLWKAFQIPLNQFERLLPFFVVNMTAKKVLAEDMPLSLDYHLWNFAQENKRQLTGIETFEEQTAILKAIPIELQVKMLLKISGNVSTYRKQLLHLTTVYQTRDIQKIYKAAKAQLGGLRTLMLYRRNVLMAARIDAQMQANAIFVAVGAAHLGGAKGILRLLKQRGYCLETV